MKKIQFFKSSINDFKAIQEIGYKTFKGSFESQNTKENMSNYLSKAFSEATIKEELENKNSLFYLVKIRGVYNWLLQTKYWGMHKLK